MINITVDASKEMRDFALSAQAKEKPYDICLKCPSLGVTCDGPNILAMEYKRWAEWANEYMDRKGLTKAYVAEESGLPLSTVRSALSGSGYDIRSETMRAITRVLIGGCWGQYPCHLAALLMAGIAPEDDGDVGQIRQLELELAKAEERLKTAKEEDQRKIEYLKEQVSIRDKYLIGKNKMITALVGTVIILAGVAVAMAII